MKLSNWPQNTTNSTFWWDQREVRKACLWTTPQRPGEPEVLPIVAHTPWPRMESLQGVGGRKDALTWKGPWGPLPTLCRVLTHPQLQHCRLWECRMLQLLLRSPHRLNQIKWRVQVGVGEAETRRKGSCCLRLPLLSHALSLLNLPPFSCLTPHPVTTERQVSGVCLPWAPLRCLFQVFAQD